MNLKKFGFCPHIVYSITYLPLYYSSKNGHREKALKDHKIKNPFKMKPE